MKMIAGCCVFNQCCTNSLYGTCTFTVLADLEAVFDSSFRLSWYIRYVLLHHVMGDLSGADSKGCGSVGAGEWAYPHGGMGAVTQAMASAAVEAGVDICLNTVSRSTWYR